MCVRGYWASYPLRAGGDAARMPIVFLPVAAGTTPAAALVARGTHNAYLTAEALSLLEMVPDLAAMAGDSSAVVAGSRRLPYAAVAWLVTSL